MNLVVGMSELMALLPLLATSMLTPYVIPYLNTCGIAHHSTLVLKMLWHQFNAGNHLMMLLPLLASMMLILLQFPSMGSLLTTS